MAFKMKGFPYKTGFKHADSGHSEKDHQHINVETTPKQTSEGEILNQGLATFDVDREYNFVLGRVEGANRNNPYWTGRLEQLQAYMDSRTEDNPQGDWSLMKGYKRATP